MKSNKKNEIQEALHNIQSMMSRDDFKKMQDDILELTEREIIDSKSINKSRFYNDDSIESGDVACDELTANSLDSCLQKIVKDLLKPELIKWLNTNLPGIVEKIVEREIRMLMPDKDD